MQTWIKANIGKLIERISKVENSVNLMNTSTNHNDIFGGRNLTNIYTIEEMYDMIHSGDFDGLYLGDYFTVSITTDIYTHFTGESFESGVTYYEMSGTINNRVWTETEDETPQSGKTYATKQVKTENVDLMFAAFDYYYNIGDTALTNHHAVLIPKTYFSTQAKMNPTNTTTGGYLNCDMHQITLPCYAKSLKTALNNHLIVHKTWLTTANNASSWADTELQLMNELQICGTMVSQNGVYGMGADNEKLPVFNFINPSMYARGSSWLRSIGSGTSFASYIENGMVFIYGASTEYYIRPLIVFG